MNKNSLTYTVIFSFIATFVLILPLAFANEATKDLVQQNKQVAQAKAILNALGGTYTNAQTEAILANFDKLKKFTQDAEGNLREVSTDEVFAASKLGKPITPLYFRSEDSGEPSLAGTFTGPGLWGNITLALGFNESFTRIKGMQMVDQVETPGLGGRIGEDWFLNQFKDQQIPSGETIRFKAGDGTGDKNKDDDAVDAVTGATISSNSVQSIVGNAILQMKKVFKGATQ